MTAEEILQRYKNSGGDATLMTSRVPNLIDGAIAIVNGLVQENKDLYSVLEILGICSEAINSQAVQELFEDITLRLDK